MVRGDRGTTLSSHHSYFLFIQPLKMDLTEGSETSEKHNLTPGKHPKEHIQKKPVETIKTHILYPITFFFFRKY
jgi:hypothetical protein